MLDKLDLTEHIRLLGWLAIIICVVTWGVDFAELVSACPYCRTERSTIGLLGVVMVLPHSRYLSIFFALVIGFMGCHVASAQVFMRSGSPYEPRRPHVCCPRFERANRRVG